MNEPKIRFKGFEGEWESTFIGKLFKERNERNPDGKLLSVTMHHGVVKASTTDRADNSSSDKSHYKLVREGDIAYNSMRMWQGACGLSHYTGIVSPAYTVIFSTTDIAPDFFVRLFKNSETLRTFRLNSQGLTSDTWNLKYPTLSNISVYSPTSKREQVLVSNFFGVIDKQIVTTISRLACLKQMKAASLQAMFPQEGGNCA